MLVSFITTTVLPRPLMARAGLVLDPEVRDSVQHELGRVADLVRSIPRSAYDVGALAEQLGPDPAQALAFVRDRIRLDLYPGTFKGADGCLRTGSGNALDRSLLLAELLRKQGGTVRFAFGTLDADRARTALDRMLAIPSSSTTSSAVPPAPLCEGCEDRLESSGQAMTELLLQTEGEARTISEKMTGSGVKLREPWAAEEARLLDQAREHVWVQLQQGDKWVDLDSTFADAQVGAAFAPVRETPDHLPGSLHQRMSFRVKIRRKQGEQSVEETVLDVTRETSGLQGRAIALVVAPEGATGPLLPQNSRRARRFVARMRIGADELPGKPFEVTRKAARKSGGRRFSDPGGGLLGGFAGEAGQEVAPATDALEAAWLEVAVELPGQSLVHRRVLFDRGTVPEVSDADVALALVRDVSIMVDVGPENSGWITKQVLDSLTSHADQFQDAMRNPDGTPRARKGEERGFPLELLAFNQTAWSLTEQITRRSFQDVRTYRGSPAVLTFQSRYHPDEGDTARLATGYDIIQSPYRTWHRGDSARAAGLAGQLGVMNTLLEHHLCGELAGILTREIADSSRHTSLPAHAAVVGMPEILESARTAQLSLAVLSAASQVEALTLPPAMKVLAQERLAQGRILVALPATSKVSDKDRWAFWEVDPDTGNLLGVLDTGGGQAMVENAITRSKIASIQFQLFLFTHRVRIMFLLASSCLIGLGYMLAVQSGAVQGETAALAASDTACLLLEAFHSAGFDKGKGKGKRKGGGKDKKQDKPVEKTGGDEGKDRGPGFGEKNKSDIPSQGTVSKDPDAPPVNAGQQGKHVKGHPNDTDPGRSKFADGVDHVAETQNAWKKGSPVPGQPQARSYNTGKRIGSKGEKHIKVVMDDAGTIHGYPNDGPQSSQGSQGLQGLKGLPGSQDSQDSQE